MCTSPLLAYLISLAIRDSVLEHRNNHRVLIMPRHSYLDSVADGVIAARRDCSNAMAGSRMQRQRNGGCLTSASRVVAYFSGASWAPGVHPSKTGPPSNSAD